MRVSICGNRERPCALLLHTMFTTGKLFADMLPELTKRYFVLVPTLDGYELDGGTDYPGTEAEAECIEGLLAENGVTELAVAAGSSLGAMLAWALWRRGKLPIRRLVLDSAPFGWDDAVAKENTEAFWQLAQAARSGGEAAAVFDRHYGRFGPMMRDSCAAASYDTIRRSCRTCFGPRLPEHLEPGGTQVVLLYGSEDPNYQVFRQDLERRRDLRLLVQEGFGHSRFLMERPLEFTALL